jgi:hypothetical protein
VRRKRALKKSNFAEPKKHLKIRILREPSFGEDVVSEHKLA